MWALRAYLDTPPDPKEENARALETLNYALRQPCLICKVVPVKAGKYKAGRWLTQVFKDGLERIEYYQTNELFKDDYEWLRPQIEGVKRMMQAMLVYLQTPPTPKSAHKKAFATMNSVLRQACLIDAPTPCQTGHLKVRKGTRKR